jgi:methyl-accepting chemotaxis protein
MYPIGSSIENIVLSGGQLDKLGNVIKSFIRICKQKGNGYVNYTWDKPTLKTPIKDVPKLSYVKLYEPLGWIIGTGVYIDDIDKTIARQKEFFYQKMKLLIINVLVASFLLIFFISILRYFVGQYKKRAAVESPSATEETEETVTTPNTQQQVGISVNESLTFAKKISQLILAEQTKLLAYAISIAQSNQTAKSTNKPEIADENVEQLDENVEQLADKVHHSVTNFQEKMVEKIQKFRAY